MLQLAVPAMYVCVEKLNYAVVTSAQSTGIPTVEEEMKLKAVQDVHRKLLTVPRRFKFNAIFIQQYKLYKWTSCK